MDIIYFDPKDGWFVEGKPQTRKHIWKVLNEIGKSPEELSPEAQEDLKKIYNSLYDLEEFLRFRRLDFKSLEKWVSVSYKLYFNPLPHLRKEFEEVVDVIHYLEDKPERKWQELVNVPLGETWLFVIGNPVTKQVKLILANSEKMYTTKDFK